MLFQKAKVSHCLVHVYMPMLLINTKWVPEFVVLADFPLLCSSASIPSCYNFEVVARVFVLADSPLQPASAIKRIQGLFCYKLYLLFFFFPFLLSCNTTPVFVCDRVGHVWASINRGSFRINLRPLLLFLVLFLYTCQLYSFDLQH